VVLLLYSSFTNVVSRIHPRRTQMKGLPPAQSCATIYPRTTELESGKEQLLKSRTAKHKWLSKLWLSKLLQMRTMGIYYSLDVMIFL
jgi:hypothetical protein